MTSEGSAVDALARALPPGITLAEVALPDVPEVRLALLDPACLDAPLVGAPAGLAHTRPPYWAFAWASGQVLARHVLDHPEVVRGLRVADLGAGSGLVAIAAALAGAREVVAIDRDEAALEAALANARASGVTIHTAHALEGAFDVALAADVLYDARNVTLLDALLAAAPTVIVAESRFDVLPHRAYVERGARDACTHPDIDESATLKHVRLFHAAR